MNWMPFIIGCIGIVALAFVLVGALGTEGYRNWVKSQHKSPLMMLLILAVALIAPFAAIFLQG